ncbi:hypothetical protein [Kitasatospora sp. NPDC056184]|uniref:hypothetical protein n=1 Tax=Kitasatospora sp. NPDC056184 TaxID=3345738 RepID=UPI0035D8F1BE
MTGTAADAGVILYGDGHFRRVLGTGRAENVGVVEQLPRGTGCVPVPGGVLVHPPR